jgi:mevalonate kinase
MRNDTTQTGDAIASPEPSAGAMRAAEAIVGDYSPLLGTVGDPDDDCSRTLALHIDRESGLGDAASALRALVGAIMNEAGGADLLPVHTENDPEHYALIQRARSVLARIEGSR